MIGFSAAFASPFVLFAMFPQWLESLPKSGSWMNVVKVLLGFIELAAAIKFFSNVDLVLGWGLISRPFAIALWIAIFLIAGLYLLGVFVLKHEKKPEYISTGRLLLAMPFLMFSFYLIPGLMGASLGIWDSWLPPKMQTDVSVVGTIAAMGEPEMLPLMMAGNRIMKLPLKKQNRKEFLFSSTLPAIRARIAERWNRMCFHWPKFASALIK